MKRKIIRHGDTADEAVHLYLKSKPVNKNDDIKSITADLIDTLLGNPNPRIISIAAPQIGINKRMITVMTEDGFTTYINPLIIKTSPLKQKTTAAELCLSCDREVYKSRFNWITVLTCVDSLDKTKKITFHGDWARIMQHEIDHLNGIIITN